jgi:hypothetical protein
MGTLIWLFGRGASIACGLAWTVPAAWASLPRGGRISRIRQTLRVEMDSPIVDTSPYSRMLDVLGRRTATGWRHRFVTTNWDTLLEREVKRACPIDCPPWLESSYVFHLNGTVEDLPDNSRRSCFLLETDPIGTRVAKLESNIAFTDMTWSDCFVVIGMSFECATDNSLLTALGNARLPVEGSRWLVLNPDESALDTVCENIQSKLRGATVVGVPNGFAEWLGRRTPELQKMGVLSRSRLGAVPPKSQRGARGDNERRDTWT